MGQTKLNRSWFVVLAFSFLMGVLATPANATAPIPDNPAPPGDLQLWLEGGPEGTRDLPTPLGPFNYLREFDQMVAFLAAWQVQDPDSSDFGGMIEAEAGHLGDVIQTDNTLEAIWCWSRYKILTGLNTYDDNLAAAWVYCTNFPAWTEEGEPGVEYYRVHNSAWGLTAVLEYAAATGDHSYDSYAVSCANHIRSRPLNLSLGDTYTRRLNAFVKGWAAGNLYLYGEALGDQMWLNEALTQGQDVLDWLNILPRYYLAYEYWAMSSGTSVWGVCNSVFRDDPASGLAWLAENAEYVDVWQDYYDVPGYDWDTSWNVAYCNAHFAIYDITGDPLYRDNGEFLVDALLSLDTDDDGGIMASTAEPNTEDASWVSSYLIKFGIDRMLGDPVGEDVGVLRFAGLSDRQHFDLGEPIPVKVLATNFGLNDQTAVTVNLSGTAGSQTWTVDLPLAALDTLTHDEAWMPPQSGFYTLTAWTDLDGDEVPDNDLVTITLEVGNLTPVAGSPLARTRLGGPDRNPIDSQAVFRLELARSAPVQLEIFDVRGRRIASLGDGWLGVGDHALQWNGRDTAGRPTPTGVYLYRLSAGDRHRTGKLVKVR